MAVLPEILPKILLELREIIEITRVLDREIKYFTTGPQNSKIVGGGVTEKGYICPIVKVIFLL